LSGWGTDAGTLGLAVSAAYSDQKTLELVENDLGTGAQSYPGDDYIDKRMHEGKEVVYDLARKMGAKYSTRFPASFKGRGGGHTNGTCRAGSDRRNSVIKCWSRAR